MKEVHRVPHTTSLVRTSTYSGEVDFFASKIIASNIEVNSIVRGRFLCIFLLVISGTQCIYNSSLLIAALSCLVNCPCSPHNSSSSSGHQDETSTTSFCLSSSPLCFRYCCCLSTRFTYPSAWRSGFFALVWDRWIIRRPISFERRVDSSPARCDSAVLSVIIKSPGNH